jgi:methionine-rich copper-binding protein CopC
VRARGGGLCVRLATAALSVLVLPAAAAAHARLVRSSPSDGARVAVAPRELSLCFNELLEREFHAIELVDEGGPGGGSSRPPVPLVTAVDRREGTCLVAALPSLAPGPYAVRWRVVSRDGHVTRGLIRFRVG